MKSGLLQRGKRHHRSRTDLAWIVRVDARREHHSVRERATNKLASPSMRRLFYELSGSAVRPRIVGKRELDSVRNRRVRIKPKNVNRVRVGIGGFHLAQNLKCLRSDLA